MEANTISRSHSSQGLRSSNALVKIPLPPRLWWTTDVSNDSSDDADSIMKDENGTPMERSRVRSRFRHHKQKHVGNVPIGIFWDIENCQVPRGCSALDVVTTIRSKFLPGRREADFVVVCDVRKESPLRLQELNDAQVSLIHVCGTQKNAADDKLRQCMRRFGELHSAPAALLLISGDINFAADLSDFRYRKNMEVILLHKQHTSSALIACATSHYCYNDLIADVPRNAKSNHRQSATEDDEEEDPGSCSLEVHNLPPEKAPERVSRRLRRLADNCGGKVLRVTAPTAVLRFPTPDHASRALKRMDGEDVFGYKIGTRLLRGPGLAYSSDEGYATATAPPPPRAPTPLLVSPPCEPEPGDWARALELLPPPPAAGRAPPRRIRGTHGSSSLDQSGASSTNSVEGSAPSRAASPWNTSSSASFVSDAASEPDEPAELTVTNLPPLEARVLQETLLQLFSMHVPVVRVTVWPAGDGPVATVVLKSEWDARLAIARIHKRRLENQLSGRRLELSLGRPSPAPNLDVLRARLRAILLEQAGHALPLLRLRDTYAGRHCCALTTSDIAKVKDTVHIQDGFGRMVQLVDLTPVTADEMEAAPWKCHLHASLSAGHDDGARMLAPVCLDLATLAHNTRLLVESHGGIVPLLSFVECYEAMFPPLRVDAARGVPLEQLLRSAPGASVRDSPSRHVTWCADRARTPDGMSSDSETARPRTAPALEPMLTLFERDLVDLLRTAPRSTIPFSKLIPAFHHHFGRQCRVADYGFTKLPELLAALSNTIVVLGSGSSRVITISAAAQSRRWNSDLTKLLRAQPNRCIYAQEIPQLYQMVNGKSFSPVDYGVCTLPELMKKVSPQAAVVGADGSVSLPRSAPTTEERARAVQFAVQATELLCYTPNLRMEFSRFVPSYHAHFGRQLRVAHYGCVKLVELFEMIPHAVRVTASGEDGLREVRLALRPARAVFAQRLHSLAPLPLAELCAAHVAQYGAVPQPDMLDAGTLEELVLAAGGAVTAGGEVRAPGASPGWVALQLAAAAALAADRSVRGSEEDYLRAALGPPDSHTCVIARLAAAGVLTRERRRVRLRPAWRAVLRAALLLPRPKRAAELRRDYTQRYEPRFPSEEIGFENIVELMRHYREVFVECDGLWSLAPGVTPPPAAPPALLQDFSLHDTPPGQKGSRVFESPKVNLWSSPPASALPAPSALLCHDVKRRTRLAAQFNAV